MAKKIYTYGRSANGFRLMLNGKPLTTPKGVVVETDSEELAEKLMTLLNGQNNANHTSVASLMCYHYTYCDTKSSYTREQVVDDLCASFQGCLENDPYVNLTIAEGAPKMTEAGLKKYIAGLNYYQLIAIMVVLCSRDTIMLPYAIMSWFCGPEAEGKSHKSLKRQFMEQLEAYERENFEIDEEDEPEFRKYLTNTSRMVDAFTYYAKL